MNLRPYQVDALETIWRVLQEEYSALLVAACSAGKTIIFSKLTQRLLKENPAFRVLILTDREILVTQTEEKILHCAPELLLDVGLVCASVSSTKTLDKRVTIASRQSLINRLGEFSPVHLIIIDEVHLVAMPQVGVESDQFGTIISALRKYNPHVRLLGVTATPYRLTTGYIYGNRNSDGCIPYFRDANHAITTKELTDDGFLAPLIGKTVKDSKMLQEIENTRITAGEYNLSDLNNVMINAAYIAGVVNAWKEHASDRKKTIVFCVTIDHAEKVAKAFEEAGIPSTAIHSQQNDMEAYVSMQSLKNGSHAVYTSVAMLTTGMDVPDIDCLIMARPTKSTALYKQILGRGMRIAAGKTNCLVLDMVGNNAEFGTDLDDLHVAYKKRETNIDGTPSSKECPECKAELHPAIRICTECGYSYPLPALEDKGNAKLTDVTYGGEPEEMTVSAMYVNTHISKKSGKKLLQIRFELKKYEGQIYPVSASLWLCFPGDGYTGFAVDKGAKIWEKITGGLEYPDTAEDAAELQDYILQPQTALVEKTGKFYNVTDFKLRELEEAPF